MKEKPTDAKKSVGAAGEEGATTFDKLLALGQMDAIAKGGHSRLMSSYLLYRCPLF